MEDKLTQLNAMKRNCVFLLLICIMVAVGLELLFPHSGNIWIVILKGMFEASVVGAMADWYAVVALFKHPLGIKSLPHTAIIPRKKDAIGENLGKFIKNEFMDDQVLLEKLKSFKVIDKLFDWLEQKEKAYYFSNLIRKALLVLTEDKENSYLYEFAKTSIFKFASEIDAAKILARILVIFNSDKYRNDFVDICITEILTFIDANKEAWFEKIDEKGVFGTVWIGKKYVKRSLNHAEDYLRELMLDENHAGKQIIREKIAAYIHDLQHDQATMALVNTVKNDLINGENFLAFIQEMVSNLRTALDDDLKSDNSFIIENIHNGLQVLVKKYRTDEEFNNRLNEIFEHAAQWFLSHKDKIADHLANEVKKWDSHVISNKLELEIGRDLQYIRISGTVVGGLVGGIFAFLLHLLHQTMGA